ncbi:MAG: response regulator transcription factor [Nitrospira sp.]
MRQLRIVLAEDQPQVLHFLKLFQQPNYDVVAAVHDRQDLMTAAKVMKPDIVVMDLDMPRFDGIRVIPRIHNIVPDCRVILKSSHADPESMVAAYDAGASAYLVKCGSPSLMMTLRAVIDYPKATRQWDTVLSNEPR